MPLFKVLLPLLEMDLLKVMKSCISGTLNTITPRFNSKQSAVAIVTVSQGYPGSYKKGLEITGTVEPVLKDHSIDHKNVVCQDRWSLATCSVIMTSRSFCGKCVVCQDRWPLMAVVSQDRSCCSSGLK